MGLPIEGTKKAVTITGPCGTEEVGVVGGALNVNAVIAAVPAVDTPNSQVPFTMAAPYVFVFVPAAAHKIGYITAAFSGLTPGASITVNIVFTFAAGAGFSTIVVSETFVANGAGFANFFTEFNDDRAVGDGYQILATTTSVLPGGTISTIISTQ